MLTVLAIRARRRSGEALVAILQEVALLAPRIFVPASLVLVVTGFGLLATDELPYELWVILALVGWAITFLAGLLVLTPQVKRAESLLDEHGPASEVALGQVPMPIRANKSRCRRLFPLAELHEGAQTVVVLGARRTSPKM